MSRASSRKVAKVLLPKDYVRYRMTGDYASDMSDSSGTFWLDIAKRAWSDALLDATDMRRDQMPKLYEGTEATGRLTPRNRQGLGHAEAPGGGGRRRRQCGVGLRHRRGDARRRLRLDRHVGRASSSRTTNSVPIPSAPSTPSAMRCPIPGIRWA